MNDTINDNVAADAQHETETPAVLEAQEIQHFIIQTDAEGNEIRIPVEGPVEFVSDHVEDVAAN